MRQFSFFFKHPSLSLFFSVSSAGTPLVLALFPDRSAQANVTEQRWQEAAAALGPAERQAKFLRLLGAKKGATAVTAAAAGPTNGNPGSSGAEGGSGVDRSSSSSRAANAKVCVCVCVFIKLHIAAQSGPIILVIICHSH